jgi:uncharacterized protein involved in outer membrane biogenesis
MKRNLLIAAIVLVMVIAGVAVFLYNSIDSIVASAIERFGTDITGTRVTVGSVDISLKSGRGTIRNLRVDNPDGFSSGHAIELGEITVDIQVASLNKDPIVIEEIRVKSPVIRAELDERARSNVGIIKEHVEGYQTVAAKPESPKRDGGYEKHFVIRKFTFDGGKAEADATRIGSEKKEIDVPPVQLTDVGGSRGSTPDALGKTLSKAIFGQVTKSVRDQLEIGIKDKLELKAKQLLGK